MNSIKFYQCGLSLVSVLILMDHPSSARSLISSPYLPHHFIWPKGNNKSLIHYPLTEAAMRKYLITGNKLNFNHSHFLSAILHSTLNPTSKFPDAILNTEQLYAIFYDKYQFCFIGNGTSSGSLQLMGLIRRNTHKHTLSGSWEAHLSWTIPLLLPFTLLQFSAVSIKFHVVPLDLTSVFKEGSGG